ncbi:hypothetical protein M404DRAFT_1003756 [Pisolithus tinctorius Marx 270]|uniref:Uncharacterized protein n=1 Tax=Pisolithus tinctorius Marx 270 TaxID=870435 RepID=A0A0C3NZM3_PISTI|nr:hypothetical protein M404DRAFT_1003756 [Pisolithus tinctorius Marx 270]
MVYGWWEQRNTDRTCATNQKTLVQLFNAESQASTSKVRESVREWQKFRPKW